MLSQRYCAGIAVNVPLCKPVPWTEFRHYKRTYYYRPRSEPDNRASTSSAHNQPMAVSRLWKLLPLQSQSSSLNQI